jgi:hypothetical protein
MCGEIDDCIMPRHSAYPQLSRPAASSRRWLISVQRRLDYQKMETMAESARRGVAQPLPQTH